MISPNDVDDVLYTQELVRYIYHKLNELIQPQPHLNWTASNGGPFLILVSFGAR